MSEQEFEVLAAEFIERHRLGDQPSVDEYADRFPTMAEEIRELFPTMVALERLKEKKEQAPTPKRLGPLTIQQLGDYRIVREIGRGGMGIVYEAEQLSLGRRVAVKVLPKQSLLQTKQLDRFQREATTAARLHHTNIVPIFGVGHDDGYHYIVMQYIDGVGLDEILLQLRSWILNDPNSVLDHAFSVHADRSSQASEGARSLLDDSFDAPPREAEHETVTLPPKDTLVEAPQPPPVQTVASAKSEAALTSPLGAKYWRSVARLGQQAASAVGYAHEQGTLHRDVKPSNLLLDSDGHLWIADFGLAKAMEQQDGISRTGDVVGTLAYMAPEQLSGASDARSDVYSLGLTLYELLTLQPAFTAASYSEMLQQISDGRIVAPRKRNPETPRDLETIVLKAVAREPASRYASAQALADDLQRFLDDRPIQARRATLVEHSLRWARRNPLAAGLCGAVAGLVAALLTVLTWAYTDSNRKLQVERDEQDKTRQTLNLTVDVLDQIYDSIAPDRISDRSWAVDDEAILETPTATLSPTTVAVLEELIRGYERLATVDTQNRDLQIRAARAQRRVGETQLRLGRLTAANTALESAIEQYQALAQDGDESYVVEIARIRNTLGEVKYRQQERAGRDEHLAALELLRGAEEQSTALVELRTPAARFELARTMYLLGRRLDRPADLGGPGGRRPSHRDGEPGGRDGRPPRDPGGPPPGFPPHARPRPDERRSDRPHPDRPRPGDRSAVDGEQPDGQRPPHSSEQRPEPDAFTELIATEGDEPNPTPQSPITNEIIDPCVQPASLMWQPVLSQRPQPPSPFPPRRPGQRPGRRVGQDGPFPGDGVPGDRPRPGQRPGQHPGQHPGRRPGQRPGHRPPGDAPGQRPGSPERGSRMRPFDGPGPRHPLEWLFDQRPKQPPENAAYLKRAIEVLKALETDHPGNVEVTRLRGLCHRELADTAHSRHLDEAISVFEQLHQEHPDVADFAFDLSRAYMTHLMDGPAFEIGREKADARFSKARQLLESLTKKNPSDIEYAHQLALVLLAQTNKTSHRLSMRNPEIWQHLHDDLEVALRLQTRATNLMPDSPFQQSALASIEYRYAETCSGLHEYQAAGEVLAESISRLEAFLERLESGRHRRLIEDRLADNRGAISVVKSLLAEQPNPSP